MEAGKKKELSALIDSILGPLNTLIDSAGRNGGGVTQDEWEKMWKMIVPGVQSGAPPVSQSNYEPSGVGAAEAAIGKLPASLSLAGSLFADMLAGKGRDLMPEAAIGFPRKRHLPVTPSMDRALATGDELGAPPASIFPAFNSSFAMTMKSSYLETPTRDNGPLNEVLSRLAVAITQFTSESGQIGYDLRQTVAKMNEPVEIVMSPSGLGGGYKHGIHLFAFD